MTGQVQLYLTSIQVVYAHPLAYRAASNGMQMASYGWEWYAYVDGEPTVEVVK